MKKVIRFLMIVIMTICFCSFFTLLMFGGNTNNKKILDESAIKTNVASTFIVENNITSPTPEATQSVLPTFVLPTNVLNQDVCFVQATSEFPTVYITIYSYFGDSPCEYLIKQLNEDGSGLMSASLVQSVPVGETCRVKSEELVIIAYSEFVEFATSFCEEASQ